MQNFDALPDDLAAAHAMILAERAARLAAEAQVSGAKLENGLLTIDLVRELPELLKPRKVEIGSAAATKAKPKVVDAANDETEAA